MKNQSLPKISVIVPVFSVEKHLSACIESLINQTLTDIEIILINDGSTDASGEICDRYAERDGRITVIHKKNGGVSSARNAGLDAARGEWIGFADADDLLEPDAYEYILGNAERYGADIAQCAMFFDESGKRSVVCSPESDIISRDAGETDGEFFKYFSGGVCCKLFKKETVDGIRFNPHLPIGEDMRFNLDALARSGCTVLCTQPKYHYVQRGDSACNSAPTRERLTSYSGMLHGAAADFSETTAIADFIRAERARNAMHVCSQIVRYKIADCDDVFSNMRKEIRELEGFITAENGFTAKEKLKARLISRHPKIYKFLIGTKKK